MESTIQNMQTPKGKSEKGIWILSIVIVIVLIGIFSKGFGLAGFVTKNPTTSLEIGNSPMIGNPNAKVTIFIFSDFSCPYCAAAAGYNDQAIRALVSQDASWEPPLKNIEENYIQNGKVKLVFKYYPGHGAGEAAQIVALALNDQNPGIFWKFDDLAFANQKDTGDLVKMKALSKQLGANMTQLENDIKTKDYGALLKEDTLMGKSNGVSGTPSFFINGKLVEGAQSYSVFKNIIDSELNK